MSCCNSNWQSFALIITTSIILAHLRSVRAAPIASPASVATYDLVDTLNAFDDNNEYPAQPNEVLPIQPLLLYPKPRQLEYQGRSKLQKDNEITYVKLLRRKNYRPKNSLTGTADSDNDVAPHKELTMKDIFYVKALANGQFSHQRVKWYRLPEFYAISVFRKGEKMT